jgi:hypothetical protein
MITCPMCKKKLPGRDKECPACKADVSLLVEYVDDLREGLARAEALTRAGQLGEAVWAYLEVLEIDPDNATARRQVGKVATAVRQFDETAPGRRWLSSLHKQKRWQRWLAAWQEGSEPGGWLGAGLWFLVVLGALFVGFLLGVQHTTPTSPEPGGTTVPAAREAPRSAPETSKTGEEPARPVPP